MKDLFSTQIVVRGDCLERMKEMDACSIDCIVTDPPYMINFMQKDFDRFENNPAASVEVWKQALRVSKPGAMLLAFGADRTHHYLMNALENAGWEIRTCLYWITGQGFPKSHNFGKKLGAEWEGYGTALKPGAEIIVMAMKPLDGTFAQNAEKWGVAGINIDACRVETTPRSTHKDGNYKGAGNNLHKLGLKDGFYSEASDGRWPANIIFDEEAAEALDEMSGFSKSSKNKDSDKRIHSCVFGRGTNKGGEHNEKNSHTDSGGASRFFYCAKASSAERNKGLEGMELVKCGTGALRDYGRGKVAQNTHPTVKPLKLLEYLLKLVMPPFEDAVVLDPFVGSGSTLVAAKNLGFNAIGIELSDEYADIAEKRVEGA